MIWETLYFLIELSGIADTTVAYKTLPMIFYTTFAFFLANFFRKSVLPLIITLVIFLTQGLINNLLFKMFKEVAHFSVFSHSILQHH
ncbi:hypothetical protein COD19_10875 [Bacillus cereus]|uniref:Uncharacterized protein n=1 Tax=Bacillus cereus TaxID=1396 RepID=A0A2C1LWK3_BACCE|nr:hypothetical protein COD19_10875 [Bacillus cereus]